MKIHLIRTSLIPLLWATLLAGTVAGCAAKSSTPAAKAANSAAQTWLTAVDQGDYSESWTNAAVLFQQAITSEKWTDALQQVRQPLGSLISRKIKSAQEMSSLPGAPDGRYIVMQFETSFANKQSAVETVTFILEKDGQWRAAGYYIK